MSAIAMDGSTIRECVTCPFCGLACDDLKIAVSATALSVQANGCEISTKAFLRLSQGGGPASPRVAGKDVALEQAISAAAEILRHAHQPLIGGLAVDVSATRVLLELAERCGAVLDHMNSRAKLRNLLTLQTEGWITTTLTEAKNHADQFLFVGTDVISRFPRFFERVVWPGNSLFAQPLSKRRVAYLGQASNTAPGIGPGGTQPTILACANEKLPQVIGALRALANGRSLDANAVAGVSIDLLQRIAESLRQAAYGVVAWAAADLDFPHAELTVEALGGLIRDLNQWTRCAGLPLGGTDADFTINAVHLWQTGFPFRASLARGHGDYDPHSCSAERLLKTGEADALLWVTSLNDRQPPPQSGAPTIVISPPTLALDKQPDVFIPIASPGVHHAGHFFRSDKVVALPLRKLIASPLPTVEDVAKGVLALV